MHIKHNTIVFPTHIIVCDPAVCRPKYMEEMAELIADEAEDNTPRAHARVLRNNNNDGTWGLKMLDKARV